MLDNERLIVRVANALDIGAPVEDIRAFLINASLSEYDAWLTFKAGEILFNGRYPGFTEVVYGQMGRVVITPR